MPPVLESQTQTPDRRQERTNVSLFKAQVAVSALAELRVGERAATAKLFAELVRRGGEP
jgi:hypothetical protein